MNTTKPADFIAPPPPPPAIGGLSGALTFYGILLAAIFLAAPPASAQIDISHNSPDQTVSESGTVQMGFLATGVTQPITVTYELIGPAPEDAGAVAATLTGPGADVIDIGNGRLIIQPTDVDSITAQALLDIITIVDDSEREPAEQFRVRVTGFTSTGTLRSANTGNTIRVTIAASDQPAARTLTVTGAATHAETDADSTVRYTVALGGGDTAFSAATTVTWTVTPGSAAAADFSAVTGSIEFPTATTFDVTVAGDNLNEAAETFSVQVSVADATADGGTAYGSPATTTITDDDTITATLSGTATANEGATGDVTVTLSGGTATAGVVITYNNADATGMLTIPAGTTSGMLTLTATNDALSEDAETLSVLPADFTATSAGQVTVAGSATLTINADSDDDITVTIAADSPQAAPGGMARFTVSMSNASMAAVTVTYDTSGVVTATGDTLIIPAGQSSGSIAIPIPATAVAEGEEGMLTVTLTGVTVASGGGTAMLGTATSATVTVTSDDAAAREARLEAPLAIAGRGIGQLAVQAIQQRLRAGVGAGRANSLTVAGRELAGAGAETLAAEYLAGGYFAGDTDISAAELLRHSGFSLAGNDSVRGVSIWGSGGYVSADGDYKGVDYDGDTSAFHLGVDTGWRDGLVGVAVARSDGDTDFTVKADGMKSTLETTVTSVHPYLTRRLNRAQLWLTAGHGSGDAELREPDAVIKTDITVTTAALGATFARDGHLSAGLRAIYTRAALDAATGGGRSLPKTTAASLRLAASGQANWTRGAWSPFANFTVRHDSGDADTGIAGDLGGGIEWRAPTVRIRLTAATSVAAAGPDEQRATLSARKSSGDFALSLNLAADDAGVDTARLLHGEWRF